MGKRKSNKVRKSKVKKAKRRKVSELMELENGCRDRRRMREEKKVRKKMERGETLRKKREKEEAVNIKPPSLEAERQGERGERQARTEVVVDRGEEEARTEVVVDRAEEEERESPTKLIEAGRRPSIVKEREEEGTKSGKNEKKPLKITTEEKESCEVDRFYVKEHVHKKTSNPNSKVKEEEQISQCNTLNTNRTTQLDLSNCTSHKETKTKSCKDKNKTPFISDNVCKSDNSTGTKENKTPFAERQNLTAVECKNEHKIKSEENISKDNEQKEKYCVSDIISKPNETPFAETKNAEVPESSQNNERNRTLCKKKSNCNSDNKSVFVDDCDVCSKTTNGKNKSNSTNKEKGLKDENLFGTPKTKLR